MRSEHTCGGAALSTRLGAELGRGALGRVVRVHQDGEPDRAGKILHASHQADPKALSRFEGEAEILSRLRHENVVAVHGLESIEGERVLVMELVDGASLARAIAVDAPFPERRIAAIGHGIAAGLAAAHHAGLVHRDLKPDNVLLTSDDTPKLVDFGMARATSFAGVDPSAFAVVGTPDYMAPETLDPLAVDTRSDLYSLGCILHEMATGAPPFTGATAFAILEAHRKDPIPTIASGASASEAGRSQRFIDLVAGLLAKSPADRPQSATAVAETLASLVAPDENTAMVRASDYSVVHAGQCASCGEPAVAEVPVCFGCGLAQVALENGDCTIYVTGPGNVTEKFDAALRQALLEWLEANPALGLDSGWLSKHVPRLPFVVVTGVSERSARALLGSLRTLGLEAEHVVGGRYKLPAIRKKAWSLGGRIAGIAAASGLWMVHSIGLALLPVAALAGVGALVSGWVTAGKPVARRTGETSRALPDGIALPLARVTEATANVRERRHRESLRAVVQRVLVLRSSVPSSHAAAVDADLGRVLDLAAVATVRIDELEATLAAGNMRDTSAEARALMLERDSWAARLLELTAFLDAQRARYTAIEAGELSDTAVELAELRAHIEALEEVQAL